MMRTNPSNRILFTAVALIYGAVNVYKAASINFESLIFLPFRYEGQLFFKNTLSAGGGIFYFIRDWSTSPLAEEHPLLYFHNFDAVHLLAGMVLHLFSQGKIILFTVSLALCLCALWRLALTVERHFSLPVLIGVMTLAIYPSAAFLWAPQNLFVTLGLVCVSWNFILLVRLWMREDKKPRVLQFFLLGSLAALTETNLAVLLGLISGIFVLAVIRPVKSFAAWKATVVIGAVIALPVTMLRLVQTAIIYYSDYFELYLADIAFTHKLKVSSTIGDSEAVAFYAERGLTYFGRRYPQSMFKNLEGLLDYFQHTLGGWLFLVVLGAMVLCLLGAPFMRGLIRSPRRQLRAINFFGLYFISFLIGSIALLAFSGDTILKIYLSRWGFIDIGFLYRAAFILFVPLLIWEAGRLARGRRGYILKTAAIGVIAIGFAAFNNPNERRERFGYAEPLNLIPDNSNVITNFEPSIVAIEARSKVNMSWFDKPPSSCRIIKSETLLKMYRVAGNSDPQDKLYLFLALYPPYNPFNKVHSTGRSEILARHCVKPRTHQLLHEDQNYLLFRINGAESPQPESVPF